MGIDLDGMKETQRYMERLVGDLKGPPVLRAMSESTLLLENRVKHNMQRDWHDTGVSMASVTPDIKMRDRVLTGIVGSNVTYVPYGEYGTKPHEIVAKNAPALAFLWPKAGPGLHFFKRVMHPGIRPRRMFGKAFEASKAYIENLFDRTVTMIVERK